MQRDQKPISKLQARSTELQGKLDMMSQLKGVAQGLLSSTQKLNFSYTGTGLTKVNNLDPSINVRGTLNEGRYEFSVKKLATHHTVASTETNEKIELSKKGNIEINGRTVSLNQGDTIADVATAINKAEAGVTARVVENGGRYSLQLRMNQSGEANKIKLTDNDGLAAELGLVAPTVSGGQAQAVATPQLTADTRLSTIFRGSTTVLSLLNVDAPETLGELSKKLDDAFKRTPLVTAKVGLAEVYTGFSDARSMLKAVIKDQTGIDYDISGNTTHPTFTASAPTGNTGATTEAPEVETGDFLNVISEAQDAEIAYDSRVLTSSNNNFSFAGGQIQVTRHGSYTMDVVKDPFEVSGSVSGVSDFASSYNALVDMVNKNSKFDSKSFDSGSLFGEQQVSQLVGSIRKAIEDGTGSSLAKLGVSFDGEGKMSVDQVKLKAALDGDDISLAAAFGNAANSGATKLEKVLEGATTYGTGTLSAMQEATKRELDSVNSDLADTKARVAKKETMLRNRYKAMEEIMKTADTQTEQLSSFMGNLAALRPNIAAKVDAFDNKKDDKNSNSNFSLWG
ncbi:MAG: flagellar filament capping protein FliD [Chthonomonas sp.]|nr:flagellar filament capping protein FliD [Chthonomonas sp.]